jgi:hypothetical protein
MRPSGIVTCAFSASWADRCAGQQRLAEVAAEDTADPGEVLHRQGSAEPEALADRVDCSGPSIPAMS